MFATPEKRTSPDGTMYYAIGFKSDILLDSILLWSHTHLKSDIAIQNDIMELRSSILTAISQDRSLFAKSPTEKSLIAMSSRWGILLSRTGECSWSDSNVWLDVPDTLQGKEAEIQLVLKGLHISPAYIRPVWGMIVKRILPESGLIDFDFEVSEEVQSVHSADIEADLTEDVVQLTNLDKEKRESKQRVHELIAQAQAARRLAEHALDTFMEEYDLSDDESDFSDME